MHCGQKAGLDFFDLKFSNFHVVTGRQHIGACTQRLLGVVGQCLDAIRRMGGGQDKLVGLRQHARNGLVLLECVLQLGFEADLLRFGLAGFDLNVPQVGNSALP